jgi:hypothetical protein
MPKMSAKHPRPTGDDQSSNKTTRPQVHGGWLFSKGIMHYSTLIGRFSSGRLPLKSSIQGLAAAKWNMLFSTGVC